MHRITVKEGERAIVLLASGELDAFVAPDLIAAFDQAGATRLIVDLTVVSFMDSTALGIVVRGVREREARKAKTQVVLPRGTARRIFEMTGLDRALPVAPSVEEALG